MNGHLLFFTLFLVLVAGVPGWSSTGAINRARTLMQSEHRLPEVIRYLQVQTAKPDISPSDKDTCNLLLVECYRRQKALQQAVVILDRLSRSASSNETRATAMFRLAILQMELGREREGQATYQRLVSTFPLSPLAPPAMMFQGNYLLLVRGDKSQAAIIYNEVIKRHPSSTEAGLARQVLLKLEKMSVPEVKALASAYQREREESTESKKQPFKRS